MIWALLLIAIVAVDVLVLLFGADSTDGNDWATHRRP